MSQQLKIFILITLFFGVTTGSTLNAQYQFKEQFDQFKNDVESQYLSFRDECNKKYVDFLLSAWDWYEGKAAMPLPKDNNPVPPKPYDDKSHDMPIVINPLDVNPIEDSPQPKPIEPIKEQPTPEEKYFPFDFYGNISKVRMPDIADIKITDCSPKSISKGWELLCTPEMNNAIRDCLETRIRFSLCDWAYLLFLDKLTKSYCSNRNGATLLMAFLYCQSGYQMRLAVYVFRAKPVHLFR